MQLDIHTLLIAVALATAFSAAARVLLYRLHPTVPGLARWAWAGMLGAAGLATMAMAGALPNMLSLSLAQLLIAAGMVTTWDGYRRFVGRPGLSIAVLTTLGLGALFVTGLLQVSQSLAMRSFANAALVGLVSGLIARELLRAAAPRHLAMRATGWLYVINAAYFIVRALIVTQETAVAPESLRFGEAAAITLLWWLCVTIAVTLGMVLMTGERLQESLDRQASRDPLTGALNRRAFSQLAQREVARARRNGQPLSVLMMDLDHFKHINDRLGHSGGDAVLCLFVAVAGKVLRAEDAFCRFGGEEFLAMLPGSSASLAVAAAERLRLAYAQEASEASQSESLPFAITVSIGVGELQAGEEIESAIRRADAALYQAKAAGRNRSELAVGVTLASAAAPA